MHGGTERGFRNIGQRAGDARNRPNAANIGERDQQRGFRLHAAENAHHVVLRQRRCGGIFCFGQ